MDKIKIAVIGLGNMGRHHLRNYSELPNVKVVAVCDVQDAIIKKAEEQYNCKGYTNLDEMLAKEELDAVSIVAPTRLHHEIALKVIDKNINLLIEKPIADSSEKAEEIIRAAKAKNLTLMIGHIERFNPAVRKLKEIVDSGAIGKITSIIARRVGAFPAQIKDANVIIDLAVHDIDICSYILDKQPSSVIGNAGKAIASDREDYAEIFLTYGDQNAFIQVNWITPIRIRNLAVTGTKGYIDLNYMTQELVMYESNYSQDFDNFGDYIIKFGNPNKKDVKLEKQEPLRQELSHFIDCVKNNKTPLITGENGINALNTALEVMKQMKML
ncbi:Gfo/Idh/MocA family oxidoreductase [Candidatus Margulisiibacteriota bacterium]